MINGYSLDPHPKIKVVTEQYAVVRIPRVKRERASARGNSSPALWGGFASIETDREIYD
ncbi:hypothetical protein [Candidatus Thioglobus autotrophicus]|nr:hypothetical protein [Candidatus Thioglobus autotrophicus]WPE17598.1 hypothetical protein R5P05_05900 [Candidatus Thioglobus autotrophicus]